MPTHFVSHGLDGHANVIIAHDQALAKRTLDGGDVNLVFAVIMQASDWRHELCNRKSELDKFMLFFFNWRRTVLFNNMYCFVLRDCFCTDRYYKMLRLKLHHIPFNMLPS